MQTFEQAAREISTLTTIFGLPYLRLMRPLRTETGAWPATPRGDIAKATSGGGISNCGQLQPLLEEARKRGE